MPWFRVDDTFAMHEKTLAAGNAAIGLWTRAGSWAMQQLTDGFVPDHIIRALGSTRERKNLVNAGLWEEASGGVQFVNWSERNPSKEQVETARQAAAERQRHARDRAKSQRESRRDNSVSHGPPNPTQPNPTQKKEDEANASSSREPRKRGQRLPDGWIPDAPLVAAMTAECPTVDQRSEHPKFVDYWRSQPGQKGTKVDWDATWRNWIRRAAERTTQPARNYRQEATDQLFAGAMVRAVEADRRQEAIQP